MEIRDVSVIGLGKLGSPMVACFASKGLRVIGVDLDAAKVEALNNGIAPVQEPQLQTLLTQARGNYSGSKDIAAAVRATQASFIIVPTPSEPDGGFSLRYVLPACEAIAKALRGKTDYHLVVLTSTVMPGSTGDTVLSTLERVSGKTCGVDFGLCYSPEFIAIGSVVRDFLNPDFVLVGESDECAGMLLASIYERVCNNHPPVQRMNFVNAELSKIAVNTYVTTKISFANMLSQMCERIPQADVDTVTGALGMDSRIGKKYLKGAVGYGGPCFPRDNVALAALARTLGAPAHVAEATDRLNHEQIGRLTNLAKSYLPKEGTVGILGLAYKPDTEVVEESQGVMLAQALLDQGISVVAYDPAAMDNAGRMLKGDVWYADSAAMCVQESDVVVLVTPWEEFRALDPQVVAATGRRIALIDCWRMLNRERFSAVADYVPLGVGMPAVANVEVAAVRVRAKASSKVQSVA